MNYYTSASAVLCAAMVAASYSQAGTNATIITYQPVEPAPVAAVPTAIVDAPVKPFQATLSAGYATKYTSRGLAFQNSGSDNVVPVEFQGKYNVNEKCAVIAGVKYIWMTANGLDHGRANTGVSDEGSAYLGGEHRWNDHLTTSLCYAFVNGGIPGSMNVHTVGNANNSSFIFNSGKPEEHSFVANFRYDFDKSHKGWFVNSNIRYAFRWMSGWWIANTVGYTYEMSSKASLVVSGTWNVTANYFDCSSLNANGTQGISLDLAIPCKVSPNVTVTPFASALWLGDGGIAANHRGATDRMSYREQTKVFRNFTPVFGVGMTYAF